MPWSTFGLCVKISFVRWLSLFYCFAQQQRAFSTRLAECGSGIYCDATVALNSGSTIDPLIVQFSCNLPIRKKFIKSILLEIFWYVKHIYCIIQGMASNYEPTVISKPCMPRGGPRRTRLGHYGMVLRLPRAHSLNHAWKSSKYV